MTSSVPNAPLQDAALPQVMALITQVHREATGQALAPETARAFGTELLVRLQALCSAVQQTLGTSVTLIHRPHKGLDLIAGELRPGQYTTTSLDHLIRTLLLQETAAPLLGLTQRWQAFLKEIHQHDAQHLLDDPGWNETLIIHLWFLVRTHEYLRRGLNVVDAQRAAAQVLAESFDVTIVTQGHSHQRMRAQAPLSPQRLN